MRAGVAELVRPTFEWCPPSVDTDGPAAAELAASAGLHLDPWQRYAVDRILAVDERGLPAAFEAAVIVPRQNGKGSILEALTLHWLMVEEASLVLHTAHEFKTASEAFRRIRGLLNGSDDLAGEVDRVLTGAGSEAVELVSGPRLRFVARSKGSGRGFTAVKIILDEAYAVEAEEMAALLPTLATQPAAQIVYTSSAGMASSDHLRSVRDRGRAGGDPALCWLEWGGVAQCPPKCDHDRDGEHCALNDRALWRNANPGTATGRTTMAFLGKARRSMTPEAWAREFLGVWDEPAAAVDTIPLTGWDARTDPASTIVGQRVIAVEVATDASSSAIAGAGLRADGGEHLALVDHRRGTSWAVPRVLELLERPDVAVVVVDPGAPGAMLLPDLRAAGLRVRTEADPSGELALMSTRDAGAAAGMLRARVAGDAPSAWHRGDPILHDALAAAGRRPIGNGGWGFDRRGDADITPIVAVAEALWGLVTGVLPEVSLFVGDDPSSPEAEADEVSVVDEDFPWLHREVPEDDDLVVDDEPAGGGVWIG